MVNIENEYQTFYLVWSFLGFFFSTGDNCELSVLLNDAEKSFQGVKLSSMFEQEFFLLFQNRFYWFS